MRHWFNNTGNWEPGFMPIFVTLQLIVTLDSICNSCDVWTITTVWAYCCITSAGGGLGDAGITFLPRDSPNTIFSTRGVHIWKYLEGSITKQIISKKNYILNTGSERLKIQRAGPSVWFLRILQWQIIFVKCFNHFEFGIFLFLFDIYANPTTRIPNSSWSSSRKSGSPRVQWISGTERAIIDPLVSKPPEKILRIKRKRKKLKKKKI